MEARIARIVHDLGYTATPEHPPTHSDVFVHEPAYSLEIQLRGTDFPGRTAGRLRHGAVCWLIADDVDAKSAQDALFGRTSVPAVRFVVVDAKTRRPLKPWDHPEDRELQHRAKIRFYATVVHAPAAGVQPDDSGRWFTKGRGIDDYQFLKEVLEGKRQWYPPGSLDRHSGLWALTADVDRFRALPRITPAPTATGSEPEPRPEPPDAAEITTPLPRVVTAATHPPVAVPLAPSRRQAPLLPPSEDLTIGRFRRWWRRWRSRGQRGTTQRAQRS